MSLGKIKNKRYNKLRKRIFVVEKKFSDIYF